MCQPSPFAEDFSYAFYRQLLHAILARFSVRPLKAFCTPESPLPPIVFLRHDVDISLVPALAMAEVEAQLGIVATYMVIPDSPLYDIRQPRERHCLQRIVALGHELALHFDSHLVFSNDAVPLEMLEAPVLEAKQKIEDMAQVEVQALSFHRPLSIYLRGPDFLFGMVNAYSRTLMSHYLSDSGGAWRFGSPLERLRGINADRVQVLTHPIWWGPQHQSPPDRLQDHYASETRTCSPEQGRVFDERLCATIPGCVRRGLLHGPRFTHPFTP